MDSPVEIQPAWTKTRWSRRRQQRVQASRPPQLPSSRLRVLLPLTHDPCDSGDDVDVCEAQAHPQEDDAVRLAQDSRLNNLTLDVNDLKQEIHG